MPTRRSRTDTLVRRDLEVIRAGQAPTGGYLACPSFPPYRYSWLRDGAFIADAVSRAGETASAEAFFRWCAAVVEARADVIRRGGRLNARYTADGREAEVEWDEFQLDGYGLWLWALSAHCERHARPAAGYRGAIGLTVDYLRTHAAEPCFDWWEERKGVHAVTLACVRAGLAAWDAAADLPQPEERLDASLLALPLLGEGDAPLAAIEERLVSPGGGVHRHSDDTYYGGGEWLLLTAMLGLAYAAAGREDDARAALDWVEAHATPAGDLPEQSQEHLLAPDRLAEWVERWGPPPSPLLWSHAMHLMLAGALGLLDIRS